MKRYSLQGACQRLSLWGRRIKDLSPANPGPRGNRYCCSGNRWIHVRHSARCTASPVEPVAARSILSASSFGSLWRAIFRSYPVCRFSQNSGELPKNSDSRSAVSAEMPRRLLRISAIRLAETPIARANWFWEREYPLRNSSWKISPGRHRRKDVIVHDTQPNGNR